MEIDGYKAVIQFDPDIDMFRGEFIGLNGGADFYARDIAGLRKEGAASLKVFLEMCEEDGVEPRRWYSGKFNLRISPELHVISAADPARKETSRTLDRWTGPNDSLASLWANPANCSFWPLQWHRPVPGSWVHRDEAQTVSAGFHPWRDGSGDRHGGAFDASRPGEKLAGRLPTRSGSLRHPTICSGRARSRFFVPGLWSRPVDRFFASCGQR